MVARNRRARASPRRHCRRSSRLPRKLLSSDRILLPVEVDFQIQPKVLSPSKLSLRKALRAAIPNDASRWSQPATFPKSKNKSNSHPVGVASFQKAAWQFRVDAPIPPHSSRLHTKRRTGGKCDWVVWVFMSNMGTWPAPHGRPFAGTAQNSSYGTNPARLNWRVTHSSQGQVERSFLLWTRRLRLIAPIPGLW